MAGGASVRLEVWSQMRYLCPLLLALLLAQGALGGGGVMIKDTERAKAPDVPYTHLYVKRRGQGEWGGGRPRGLWHCLVGF